MNSNSPTHAIIYIPGLGDHRIRSQQLALKLWQPQGVEMHLLQMNWHNDEPYQLKLERLLHLIDTLYREGKVVSLVAASAGASIAINAYAIRQNHINGVVSFCGKLQGQGIASVHAGVYGRNRAFLTSMQLLSDSEKQLSPTARVRILSMHPVADESVPVNETMLDGATIVTMPVFGHVAGIAYGLTLGSRRAIRFLKQAHTEAGASLRETVA